MSAPSDHAALTGISIQDVSVSFENHRVLDQLSLDVQPGEIVALLGASGCGKSTLLRAIANLIAVNSGQIIFSQPIRRAGDLAFVFQEAALLPWRTVRENVYLPLELGSIGRVADTTIVEKTLHTVGLQQQDYRKYPRQLSGGMRMRTSIARALVTDPSVMLLDEPFAALDDILRTRLNDLLLNLWGQRRRTILFVTHNIAEAIYLSHRVAVFGAGRIAETVINPIPWPRREEHRSAPEFAAFYGRLSRSLQDAQS